MMIETVVGLFLSHGYAILFGILALDAAGMPLAGELLLILLGVAFRSGELHPVFGLIVASSAAVVGHSAGYWMGRLTGPRLLAAGCRIAPGPWGVLLSRYLVGMRVLLPPLAGAGRMPFFRFLLLDSIGAVLWTAGYALMGYASGWTVRQVVAAFEANILAVKLVLATGIVILIAIKFLSTGTTSPVAMSTIAGRWPEKSTKAFSPARLRLRPDPRRPPRRGASDVGTLGKPHSLDLASEASDPCARAGGQTKRPVGSAEAKGLLDRLSPESLGISLAAAS